MDKSNLLTPEQMAGMATPKVTSPSVPSNSATPSIPSTGLLTPTQMAQMASHQNPANPTGAVGSSWDAFDKAKNTQPTEETTPGLKDSLEYRLKQVKAATDSFRSGKENILDTGATYAGNILGAGGEIIQKGLEMSSPIFNILSKANSAIMSPIITKGGEALGDVLNTSDPLVQMHHVAGDLMSKATDYAIQANSETDPAKKQALIETAHEQTLAANEARKAAQSYQDQIDKGVRREEAVRDIAPWLLGGLEAKNPAKTKIASDTTIKNVTNATEAISNATSKVVDNASNIASNIKEKISPTPTIDQLVGKVAQGEKADVPTFTKGLENIGDTSKIKTYQDLNTASTKTIADLAKAQDANLAKETATHPISEFEQVTGKGNSAIKTNYVQQSLDQLNEYYTKTNNASGLSKVKALTEKANGNGLTVQDVNNLSRMHGKDLNGFNANGELASGLTKQAAENTRVGLKNTIDDMIIDPAVRAEFRSLDGKMSDTFTVKDLSGNMAEKVNTLTQRLQQPNILQKIGGFIGKYGRYTGVGDLMQKLLGLEKTPGASTLNAVELEAKLSKNLAKIDAALKKNDVGFASDIKKMIEEKEYYVKEQPPTPPPPTGNAEMGTYKIRTNPITGIEEIVNPKPNVIELGPESPRYSAENQATKGTTSTINPKTGITYVRDIKTGRVIKIIPKGK